VSIGGEGTRETAAYKVAEGKAGVLFGHGGDGGEVEVKDSCDLQGFGVKEEVVGSFRPALVIVKTNT